MYIYIHMYVCMYVRMYVCMYVRAQVRAYGDRAYCRNKGVGHKRCP